MAIAILLFMIFAGIEAPPGFCYYGPYPAAGAVRTYPFPLPGTTWVNCMNAVLNITFLWVGGSSSGCLDTGFDASTGSSDPFPNLHRRDGEAAGLPEVSGGPYR